MVDNSNISVEVLAGTSTTLRYEYLKLNIKASKTKYLSFKTLNLSKILAFYPFFY